MAESSAVKEIYVPEVTPGVTPANATGWQSYPLSGAGGLSATPVKVESNEVRGDRGKSAPVVVGFDVAGGYAEADFKANQFDKLIESALASSFSAGNIKNGSTLKTFTVERQFTDLTNKFLKYKGAAVNEMDLKFANVRDKVTIGFSMMAMSHLSSETASSVGTGSILPTTTSRAMTVLDLSNVTLGGVTGYCIGSGDLKTSNGLRPMECAGQLNIVGLMLGTFNVSGNLSLHTTNDSWALLAKRDSSEALPFSFQLSDGINSYTFNFPSVHVEFPDPTGEAENTSIMLNLSFDASQGATHTMEIVKA